MYEPFPGNYVWNLSVNLALCMGGSIGEIDAANEPVREAAKQGADEGTAAFFESWTKLADRLVDQAEADVEAGHKLSASDKFRRACIYYMTAERMQRHGFAPREQAYAMMLAAMQRSADLGGRNVERVEIPYEGSSYPGLFVRATRADGGPAPCMIHTNGLDSVKEMIYWSGIGDQLAARGISTLMIDHPGVGEALRLRGLHGRHDSEAWISPAVDMLQARSDVDADAIGIMGWSLGGYYAPRAAAFEKRLKLCVSWGANHFWGELQKRRLQREGENPVPHYWEHVMWVFGKPDMESFMEWAPRMTLDGVVERIDVPYLITHGGNDRQIPLEAAHRSHAQATASPKCELKIFDAELGGVEHVSADNMHPAQEFISDWVADNLG
ncbi:alpha/beta hydrolase family protein [Sphingobium chungangianum]